MRKGCCVLFHTGQSAQDEAGAPFCPDATAATSSRRVDSTTAYVGLGKSFRVLINSTLVCWSVRTSAVGLYSRKSCGGLHTRERVASVWMFHAGPVTRYE